MKTSRAQNLRWGHVHGARWKGQRVHACVVNVIVATPGFAQHWAAPLAGQRRRAVEVTVGNDYIYLDAHDDYAVLLKLVLGRGDESLGYQFLPVDQVLADRVGISSSYKVELRA